LAATLLDRRSSDARPVRPSAQAGLTGPVTGAPRSCADLGVSFKRFVRPGRRRGFADPFAGSIKLANASVPDDGLRGLLDADGLDEGALRVPALPLAEALLRTGHGLRLGRQRTGRGRQARRLRHDRLVNDRIELQPALQPDRGDAAVDQA
jgi:hypothetical protein